MKILVVNSGSSTIKYQLLDMTDESVVVSGVVDRIGIVESSNLSMKKYPDTDREKKIVREAPFPTHKEGMQLLVSMLTDPEEGVIKNVDEIDAIGHRVVQGGERLIAPVIVDEKVKKDIADMALIGPLHNPAHLMGIEVCEELFPKTPQAVVMDTDFHQTMPKKAYLYPIPLEYYEELSVRRYGFHGTSHRFVAQEVAGLINKPFEECNIITMHLGNGCSMAAIENGKVVDTSMGLTPLGGLMMGSRSGDIDPAIINFLAKNKGMDSAEIDNMLNKKSGLLGICGMSDLRDIHDAANSGDENAQLALDMFIYRIRKQIGSYLAVLGEVDAMVFTAGVGENDDIVRLGAMEGLDKLLGVEIDKAVNAKRCKENTLISTEKSSIPVWVIPTNEELAIARQTKALL